jgi:hypothetical protein
MQSSYHDTPSSLPTISWAPTSKVPVQKSGQPAPRASSEARCPSQGCWVLTVIIRRAASWKAVTKSISSRSSGSGKSFLGCSGAGSVSTGGPSGSF